MGGPTSSYTAAGIALVFIGAHKLPHPATKCFRQGGDTIEGAIIMSLLKMKWDNIFLDLKHLLLTSMTCFLAWQQVCYMPCCMVCQKLNVYLQDLLQLLGLCNHLLLYQKTHLIPTFQCVQNSHSSILEGNVYESLKTTLNYVHE
jgi:hypothetical protein